MQSLCGAHKVHGLHCISRFSALLKKDQTCKSYLQIWMLYLFLHRGTMGDCVIPTMSLFAKFFAWVHCNFCVATQQHCAQQNGAFCNYVQSLCGAYKVHGMHCIPRLWALLKSDKHAKICCKFQPCDCLQIFLHECIINFVLPHSSITLSIMDILQMCAKSLWCPQNTWAALQKFLQTGLHITQLKLDTNLKYKKNYIFPCHDCKTLK